MDEAEAEARRAREAMTEEDRQAEERESEADLKKLMDRMEREQQRRKKSEIRKKRNILTNWLP